jgi:hypothetical protein
MLQRLAIPGFIIALIAAIFLFTQQQQAVQQANTAATAQAEAQAGRAQAEAAQGTAVAQAQAALAGQAQADSKRVTAVAGAESAAAKQAQAAADVSTAQAQAAANQATAQVALTAQAAAQAESTAQVTVLANTKNDLATAQAALQVETTAEVQLLTALGTATAQVDLAQFAQSAAEQDRATALAQSWTLATAQARTLAQIATLETRLASSSGQSTPIAAGITATPSPASITQATAAPAATIDTAIELSETYTSQDGKIKFSYPKGWVIQESQNGLLLSNSQAAIDNTGNIQSGEFVANFLVRPGATVPNIKANPTARDVAERYSTIIIQRNNPNATIPPAVDLTIGSYPAARVPLPGADAEASLIVVDLGSGNFGIALALGFKGELSAYETIFRKMLASVQYTA